MAALTGNKIKDSYLGLLKTTDNGIFTSSLIRITDGGGNGSQLYLSNTAIRFHNAYTFPNADGTSGQVLSTDGSGTLYFSESSDNQTLDEVLTSGNTATLAILSAADGNTFGSTTFDDAVTGTTANFTTSVTSPDFIGDLNGSVRFAAKMIGSSVLKGQVVYVSGLNGNTPEVQLAKANSTTTMTAVGIAADDANQNASFEVDTLGSARGIDLSDCIETGITLTEGDVLYVSATEAGHLTNVAPTGVANLIQNIGMAIRVDPTTNATIKVMGAGRANASPNLPTGILLGDTTNVSTAITDGSSGQILSTDGSGTYSFVDSTNDVTKTGTITVNQIAVWSDSTNQLRSDPTLSIYEGENNVPNHSIYLYQPNGENPPVNLYSYNIGGGHLDDVTGIHNTGFGYRNLFTVTTGQENSAFGYESLRRLTSGSYNSAFGRHSLYSLTTGSTNTAFGWKSLAAITTKNGNTAFGSQVLANANGTLATEAVNNTGIGAGALYDNTTGSYNVAVGYTALANVTTGSNNVAIGNTSGSAITTGSNNVTLGGYSNNASDEGIITLSNGTGARRISVNNSGKITFHGYGSASPHTGTLAKTLGVDSSGNVIEFTSGAGTGTVAGTGTAGTITKWATGGANIEDSIIAESSSTITVDGGSNGRVRVKVNETINSFGKFDFSTSDTATSSATMIAEITATVKNTDDTTPLTSELSFATNSGDSLNTALTISSTGVATFSSSVTATTLTLSTTTADYAATITNVQDSSQGLLVRATDNDGSLFLLNLQSSGGATSQTWVDRFAVTKGGNVGIGNNNPAVPLDITSNSGANALRIRARTQNDYAFMGFYNNAGTAYWGEIYYAGSATAGSSLNFTVGSGVPKLTISSTGNVGIGTTTTESLSKLNVSNASSGAITRGLGLYNVFNGVAGTGVSLDFYVNVGVNDRCARIISTQSTAGNYADLQFQTSDNAAPATRLTISSGGNVGIGSGANTLIYPLEVHSADNGDGIIYKDTGASITNWFGAFSGAAVIGATTNHPLSLYAGGGEKMRISSGGLATFSNGIQFGTGDTLNAYEQDTYSPILKGASTAGSSPTGVGTYTVIGNVCHLNIRFSGVTVTGATGAIAISLPFAGKTGATGQTTTNFNTYNVSFTGTNINALYVSGDVLYGLSSVSGTTWADWAIVDASNIYWNLSITYLIN
jgi:hypothetical protein